MMGIVFFAQNAVMNLLGGSGTGCLPNPFHTRDERGCWKQRRAVLVTKCDPPRLWVDEKPCTQSRHCLAHSGLHGGANL